MVENAEVATQASGGWEGEKAVKSVASDLQLFWSYLGHDKQKWFNVHF